MLTNKATYTAIFTLAFGLNFSSNAFATTLAAKCKVSSTRSSIAMQAKGLKGTYYAKVFSGESEFKSAPLSSKGNGIISFKFDSDPIFLNNHIDAVAISADFIKDKNILVVLRKANSNAHVGGLDVVCSTPQKVIPSVAK